MPPPGRPRTVSSLWQRLAPWSYSQPISLAAPAGPSRTQSVGTVGRDRSCSHNTIGFGMTSPLPHPATPGPPAYFPRSSASSVRHAPLDLPSSPLPPTSTSSSHAAAGTPFIIMAKKDSRSALLRHYGVLAAAENYRVQCANLGQASYEFGSALESLARSPGAGDTAAGLSSASGLHYMMANQYALLSKTVYTSFETPVREALDDFAHTAQTKEREHDQQVDELSQTIKQTEQAYVLNAQQGARELTQFRRALQQLTAQLDELEQLKQTYAREALDDEQTVATTVLTQTSVTIRALTDICDRLSSKALTDPQLEAMVGNCPDPFNAYETADTSKELFSVLPPLAMLTGQSGHGSSGSRRESGTIPFALGSRPAHTASTPAAVGLLPSKPTPGGITWRGGTRVGPTDETPARYAIRDSMLETASLITPPRLGYPGDRDGGTPAMANADGESPPDETAEGMTPRPVGTIATETPGRRSSGSPSFSSYDQVSDAAAPDTPTKVSPGPVHSRLRGDGGDLATTTRIPDDDDDAEPHVICPGKSVSALPFSPDSLRGDSPVPDATTALGGCRDLEAALRDAGQDDSVFDFPPSSPYQPRQPPRSTPVPVDNGLPRATSPQPLPRSLRRRTAKENLGMAGSVGSSCAGGGNGMDSVGDGLGRANRVVVVDGDGDGAEEGQEEAESSSSSDDEDNGNGEDGFLASSVKRSIVSDPELTGNMFADLVRTSSAQ
ncbi:hypothetical protein IWQ60_003805 [Tieghemiomyces parasiticus]|uniref:IMD domain-containing protein n=1 Tax=Tieghemiomyces parasiticus TaxID=78921 RepID=A0A9W8A9H7_9FUNG|nr:hypothetical protein IWQ60_003805 [Tieghemiomyces parasiticus]